MDKDKFARFRPAPRRHRPKADEPPKPAANARRERSVSDLSEADKKAPSCVVANLDLCVMQNALAGKLGC